MREAYKRKNRENEEGRWREENCTQDVGREREREAMMKKEERGCVKSLLE